MSSSKCSDNYWIIAEVWSLSQYSSHSVKAIPDLFRFPMERRPLVEVEAAAERTVDWRSPAPCYRPTTSLPILHNRDRAQKGKVLWSWQIPLWKPSRFAIQRGGGDEKKIRDISGGEQCCWAETFSSTDPLFAIIRQFPIQGFKVFQIDGNTKVKLILNFVLAFKTWFCFPVGSFSCRISFPKIQYLLQNKPSGTALQLNEVLSILSTSKGSKVKT